MPAASAQPPIAGDSLGGRIRDAVLWRSGGQLAAQLMQWAATFLVIRILSPGDYGLFAMTQAVLVLLNLANGYGLASGFVQARAVTERQLRQLAGLLIALNAGLAAVQLLIAPLAAAYFGHPPVAALLQVQSLLYLATPFIAVPQAQLSRAMDFRAQARATIASSLAGAGVALGGALAGWGIWTLVAAPLALFGTRALVLTHAAGIVRPLFDVRGAGPLMRFGALVAAGQVFWFVQSQADIVIAGRSFSPHALGLYSTAMLLTQIFVSKVVPPLNEVAFAGYARLHVGDSPRFGEIFTRATRLVMALACPFGLGLAATATPLVATMLGDRWVEAAPLVRLLALAAPFMTMLALLAPACDARGRPGIAVGNAAAGAAILTGAFLLGARHGPIGLAAAGTAAYPLYLAIGLYRSLPVVGVKAADLAAALAPIVVAALAMALMVAGTDAALPQLAPAVRLAILVAVGGASYAGLLRLVARDVIDEARALLRRSRRPAALTPPAASRPSRPARGGGAA